MPNEKYKPNMDKIAQESEEEEFEVDTSFERIMDKDFEVNPGDKLKEAPSVEKI